MVARLALVCAVELVFVLALGLAVFAAPAASEAQPIDRTVPTAEPSAAHLSVPVAAPAPPPVQVEAASPLARTEVRAKWRDDDQVGVLLTGTLRLRDGRPADASVTLSLDKVRKTASASADGSYAVVGLQPGEWQVALQGQSVVDGKATLTLTDEAVQRHDFELDASHAVAVRIVTADGQDATRALRLALPQWGDYFVAGQRDRFPDRLAPTDYGVVFVGDAKWRGEMNPVDGAAGTLHLTSLPAHVALLQRHLVLEQKLIQPGEAQVEFVVDVNAMKKLAGSATLRVLDAATGEPLGKARVSMHTSNRGGGGPPVDAEGRVVLEGLSPGLLRCEVNAAEHESMSMTAHVMVGERLDLGDVRLGPLVPFTGTLLDADGKPAAAANITWTDLKWRTRPTAFASNRSVRIEADGTFSLWNTGRGQLAVTARDQTGNVAVGVFDNPSPDPIVLRLAEAGECVVRRPTDPTRAYTVTLFDSAQRPVAAHTLDPRHTSLAIRLPFGTYSFEVHDEQARSLQRGSLTFSATPCAVEIR